MITRCFLPEAVGDKNSLTLNHKAENIERASYAQADKLSPQEVTIRHVMELPSGWSGQFSSVVCCTYLF